jgi:hypothetical protein
MVQTFWSNENTEFWNQWENILSDLMDKSFSVYQAMACYHIAIRCNRHVFGDKQKHTGFLSDNLSRSGRRYSDNVCLDISRVWRAFCPRRTDLHR